MYLQKKLGEAQTFWARWKVLGRPGECRSKLYLRSRIFYRFPPQNCWRKSKFMKAKPLSPVNTIQNAPAAHFITPQGASFFVFLYPAPPPNRAIHESGNRPLRPTFARIVGRDAPARRPCMVPRLGAPGRRALRHPPLLHRIVKNRVDDIRPYTTRHHTDKF